MVTENLPEVYENIWREIKSSPSEILGFDLASLSRAYLTHLEALLPENLEKAGEYLRLTSYLIYLKSKLLLPKEDPPPEEASEDSRPTEEAKNMVGIGKVFEDLEVLGRDIFCAPGLSPPDPDLEVDLSALITAFLRTLERLNPPVVEVKRLEPLFKKMLTIVVKELENKKKTTYGELAENLSGKLEKLALFLAILELSFREFCRLIQNLPWGKIEILLRTEEL
ncbi:MAG TPA: hypothetical protein EYP81_02460 [Thermodesulfobacteriaceae bacterium]|nr:hypothetical protein [Thermodesulfobacteriaceae bacterium]